MAYLKSFSLCGTDRTVRRIAQPFASLLCGSEASVRWPSIRLLEFLRSRCSTDSVTTFLVPSYCFFNFFTDFVLHSFGSLDRPGASIILDQRSGWSLVESVWHRNAEFRVYA